MAEPPDRTNNGRFKKGQSGNPNGRPRAVMAKAGSAFEVIFERELPLIENGVTRVVSLEEALQRKTLREAFSGKRLAEREVLRWIAKRDKLRATKSPQRFPNIKHYIEEDPSNADSALQILGVATRNPNHGQRENTRVPLLLERWAVEAALARRRSKRLSDEEVDWIRRCTSDAEQLRWPRSYKT